MTEMPISMSGMRGFKHVWSCFILIIHTRVPASMIISPGSILGNQDSIYGMPVSVLVGPYSTPGY